MKIKLCGLKRPEEIEAVNEAEPEYIGFIFVEKSRRYVSPENAAILKEKLNPTIQAVGVFVDAEIGFIVELVKKQVIDVIQLHGSEDISYMKRLKEAVKIPIIKAISMTKADVKEQIRKWEISDVDYLLLDSGNGGTGEQFDYSLLKKLGKINKPYFLAGGLNPSNLEVVAKNLKEVPPHAFDLSSGIETNGFKDPDKIKDAVRTAHRI